MFLSAKTPLLSLFLSSLRAVLLHKGLAVSQAHGAVAEAVSTCVSQSAQALPRHHAEQKGLLCTTAHSTAVVDLTYHVITSCTHTCNAPADTLSHGAPRSKRLYILMSEVPLVPRHVSKARPLTGTSLSLAFPLPPHQNKEVPEHTAPLRSVLYLEKQAQEKEEREGRGVLFDLLKTKDKNFHFWQ